MSNSTDLAYLATPVVTSDRPGPWPGVVLVHDAFGSSDDMREQADWLAAAGYVVAMPDLYRGKRAITCLKGTFAQLTAQRGPGRLRPRGGGRRKRRILAFFDTHLRGA